MIKLHNEIAGNDAQTIDENQNIQLPMLDDGQPRFMPDDDSIQSATEGIDMENQLGDVKAQTL